MSSPILYNHVEIEGFRNMLSLFCTRDPLLHQPQLEPFLSLLHIRTCTLIAGEADSKSPSRAFDFSQDRVPSSLLAVRNLKLGLRGVICYDSPFAWASDVPSNPFGHVWDRLLPLFNPENVVVEVFRDHGPEYVQTSSAEIHLENGPSWPRLRRLELLPSCNFYLPQNGDGLLGIPPPPPPTNEQQSSTEVPQRRLTILVHLMVDQRTSRRENSLPGIILERISSQDESLFDSEILKELIVRVDAKDPAKDQYVERFETAWKEDESEEVATERKGRLRVEVASVLDR